MKSITVNFAGFWPQMNKENNFLINALRKHYEVTVSDHPQYLFCSCFSDEHLDYDCVKIFYTGENLVPDFNLYDYAISYEDISYGDRHYTFTDYAIEEEYGEDCKRMLSKHERADELAASKSEFCSFVVSKGSGYVAPEREELFHKISEYKKVNSGGRFLNNVGEPGGVADKLAFESRHKFAIACENSSHKGYHTEKLVQALGAGCIPIYWGDPDIGVEFNEKCFINCNKYDSLEKVLAEVKRIDGDDEAYMAMLREPALNDMTRIDRYHRGLDEFLVHIVDQEIDKAFRRDRVGYNEMKKDDLKKVRTFKGSLLNRALNKLGKGLKTIY